MTQKKALIIGAGPAGLTAAYELLKYTDIKPVIFENLQHPFPKKPGAKFTGMTKKHNISWSSNITLPPSPTMLGRYVCNFSDVVTNCA